MKVAVITRHAPSNYGSLLQTIATQKVIEKLGHACEIVNYIREDEHYTNVERTMLQNKAKWNNSVVKRSLYLFLRKPEAIMAGKMFERMRKDTLNLSRRYTSLEELAAYKPEADLYMVGSDQVWGKTADGSYDKAYFLTFTKATDRKIAYASSFGAQNISPDMEGMFHALLQPFSAISVRETTAVKLIEKMGLSAEYVLDPTLMLTADEWSRLCQPIQSEKYVLVYQIHNEKRVGEYANKVAKAKNLPLLRVSPTLHQISREGKLKLLPSYGEFLSYIKNAEYLITDSFHGTVFALVFNIPFVEILYGNGTEIRNADLLQTIGAGLPSRILRGDDLAVVDEPIDFTQVNKRITEMRQHSFEILGSMLENKR